MQTQSRQTFTKSIGMDCTETHNILCINKRNTKVHGILPASDSCPHLQCAQHEAAR